MKRNTIYFLIYAGLFSCLILSCSKEPTEPQETDTIIADNVIVIEEGGDVTLDQIEGTTFYFSYTGNVVGHGGCFYKKGMDLETRKHRLLFLIQEFLFIFT